ncbi:MAG: DUF5106 domain-containing protein, partial [Bacteroidales bacterium]|nr:DUF5106 domain-containing protein [Candidatus Colimorpha onthohippi]
STTDTLYPGLYFFASGSGQYVEFVVYHENPFFEFETDQADWMQHMKVKGSEENQCFYQFHKLSHQAQLAIPEPTTQDSIAYASYRRQLSLTMDSLKRDFIARNPQRMISKMMLSTKEIEVPTIDSAGHLMDNRSRWEYYVRHCFDNMPLDDDFLVRTPQAVFYQRMDNYVNQSLMGVPPEIICPLLDSLLDRTRASRQNFHWLLHWLTEHYLQSNIMVYDAVYVHLIQRYYATGAAWWMTPSGIETEVDRASRWDRILVGKEAPELILFDTLHVPHSLHQMPNKYKLLIFWSPSCGHCQTAIPELYNKYKTLSQRYDIGAYAILSEPDAATKEKWRHFISEKGLQKWLHLDGGEANVDWHDVYDITSTPQIYLLDEKNIIIAKKLSAETFEQVMQAIGNQQQSE